VIITDGPQHARGRPTVSGGARGMVKLELEIEAARRDVHSGNFAVPNPAWKLSGLLASMATPDGVPLIEGFEEDVVRPTPAERRMVAEVPLDLPALEKGGYDAAKTPLDLPISREVIAIVERAHGGQRAVLLPTLGGTVPMWAFTDILGLPALLVPYANQNNRQHSPNEHMDLGHLFQGVRTTARLLTELGAEDTR